MKNILIAGLGLGIVLATPIQAASFDCRKATTLIEEKICADEQLSRLDEILSINYQLMRDANIGVKALKDLKATQRQWLATRNQCKNTTCLQNVYEQRIEAICDYSVIAGVHPNCLSADDNIGKDTTAQTDTHEETAIPTEIGACVQTRVTTLGTRLENVPDSGTSISFANGVYLVDYDMVKAAMTSKIGDNVEVCLQSVPQNCPPGDERGKVYKVTNLRTHKAFSMADSQHECGGA